MRFLLCVCFCMFFCSTHGQIDGDPAPGRSPGPPTTSRPSPAIPATTHRSHKPLITTAPADASIRVAQSAVRHTRAGDDSWENETNPSVDGAPAADAHRHPISSWDDNETVDDTEQTSASVGSVSHLEEDLHHQHHRSSCSGASLYINPSETIHRDYAAGSSDDLPMRLEVAHSLFDTRRGLTNQIIYNVKLTMIPGAISDFYLETVVDDDDDDPPKPAGLFVDPDVSDVAAIIMRRNASLSAKAPVVEVPAMVDAAAFDEPHSWRQMVELLYPKHGSKVESPEDNEVLSGGLLMGDEDEEEVASAREGSNDIICTFCVCPNVWTETAVQRVRRDMKWFVDLPGLNNKTVKFRLMFRKVTSSAVFETIYIHHLLEDCNLTLLHPSASLDFTHLPLYNNYENCTVFFPPSDDYLLDHDSLPSNTIPPPETESGSHLSGATGLLVQLTRLNVPCRSGGYVAFDAADASNASRRLCGKFEDLTDAQRTHHLAASSAIRLVRHPTFRLNYRLVDFCYNVSFTGRNASYYLQPVAALNCSFSVHLPYGNRIELNVATNGRRPLDDVRIEEEYGVHDSEFLDLNVRQQEIGNEVARCNHDSLFVQLIDPKTNFAWLHCIDPGSQSKRYNVVSAGNTLVIRVWRTLSRPWSADRSPPPPPSLFFDYVALAERKFESQCAFGWIAVQQLCVAAVEQKETWTNAEKECKRRGGNLAVVRSEREQRLIDVMLVNSPAFKDNAAYWIGASDAQTEGDFRWSSGFPFSYSNWFPGYAEYNNYNKQPNDDGLSSQDCVEIRHYFQPPAGVAASHVFKQNASRTLNYMWNDRDCGAENFFLCERPMSETLNEKLNWTVGCNKTVQLTRDRPRASLWSPNFPFEYPDNTNCFTVVKAPDGFTVVLEFEEFSLENEPECSYDFLEIIDVATSTESRSDGPSKLTELYRKYLDQQKPRSKRGATKLLDTIYQKFLDLYRSVRSVVLRMPMSNADTNAFLAAKALPHRACGDWNSKLKLLRFTSSSPVLGLHFSSDYSHHASGYKAKVSIKNITSDCTDDRLISYNGGCYLFASYPEVDWTTAQSVCRGAGAELASITSADEQRFIVEHIRNQIDYTSQAVYWTGGQLAMGADFTWSDGRNMSFKGWLPGEETVAVERHAGSSTCLGLKWKMSPTPMLSSGVYWTAENCRKFGGYVCKSKQTIRDGFVENRTISGVEGRLTSPGYPNAYPVNVDYWVKLVGPTNTRLIIQFQTLDLEAQDECLYDYVSIQETKPDSAEAALDANNDALKYKLGNNKYSPQDLHAKKWFHHELSRIKRMKRDVKRNQSRLSESDKIPEMMLNHEIRFLMNLRNSLVTDTRSRRRRFADNFHTSRSPLPSATTAINEPSFQPYVRWCGSHQSNMTRFDFVASDNAALLHFHSDYSLSMQGFSIIWSAVDVSVCPHHKLLTPEGILASPNYPHFLLNHLDCSFEILTTPGKRVWLEFQVFEVLQDSLVEVDLGSGVFIPFRQKRQLNDGVFVSEGRRVVVRLRTGALPRGKGFRATYRTISIIQEELNLSLPSDSIGWLYHLNYPRTLPSRTNYTQHLTAPVGYVIFLEIYGVGFSDTKCTGAGSLEIYDHYADKNGTLWHLCQLPSTTNSNSPDDMVLQFITRDRDDLTHDSLMQAQTNTDHRKPLLTTSSTSPVHITSFLNTLHIRQITGEETSALRLNASVRIIADLHYKYKLVDSSDDVESCDPNPCQFGGKCESTETGNRCQCTGHYTGRFCGLGMCEVDPCVFGKCLLTNTGFKCKCQLGYVGRMCDRKQQPCTANPCEGRGECFNRNGGFFCRCHAWWEGQRCEKRMTRIPYKPLSDRMLQEPFWLGLITVFVVLAFIGLVWCAKRHFPEKIEKLLTEEAERNRPPGMISGNHHHHQSLREQLQFTNTASTHSTVSTPGQHRTIFTRLGIRKPSIISINSPQPPIGANCSPTARTFSLDDLLRPPPRRSPSPRKKRNNSTPTKTNAAEKTQILQQLIAPAGSQGRENIDLKELISLTAKRPGTLSASHGDIKETTMSENSELTSMGSDAKLEKKVTFARLLNKVSAEMSSGSETTNTALDLPDGPAHRRASSMPPSPCDLELRSPHSRSSTQSSESMSSSEAMLPTLGVQSHRFGSVGRPKVSSADSILNMFKNLANQPSPKTMIISPSSSMTTSSPHDDHNGDDDSSTSSLHTPVSFHSCPPEPSTSSSYFRQNAFEVPALDLVKTANNQNPTSLYLQPPGGGQMDLPSNINQCLSPIRELPTPMPSPALTPIMHRPHVLFSRFYSAADRAAAAAAAAANNSEDDDNASGDSENRVHPSYRPEHHHLLPSNASSDHTGFPNWETQQKVRSPKSAPSVVVPLIQISHDDQPTTTDPSQTLIGPTTHRAQSPVRPKQLIIPKLVVEQSSPVAERLPVLYLGSPPPQRQSVGETNFYSATPQQRKLLKQMDKPTSLDLLCIPPTITITYNMSDSSDNDLNMMAPSDGKADNRHHLKVPSTGMCYLSPFSMCSRNDRSEGNLSSSGYSSMASPGPSRCGSNNPLLPGEMEDPGCGSSMNHHPTLRFGGFTARGQSTTRSPGPAANGTNHAPMKRSRLRSDSETLSDDILLESNDEGIETDHLDDRIDETSPVIIAPQSAEQLMQLVLQPMQQLQLPTISIQPTSDTETTNTSKAISPVSSRSESPLSSDRNNGTKRFSSLFYGSKEMQMPFTDSDGLYDFPSSDGKMGTLDAQHSRKTSLRRRERKLSRGSGHRTPSGTSPTKQPAHHLEANSTSGGHLTVSRRSPKRRAIVRHKLDSSSSSSESIIALAAVGCEPVKSRAKKKVFTNHLVYDASTSVPDHVNTMFSDDEDLVANTKNGIVQLSRPNRRISRLRAFGNQLRFLRRFEQSLGKRRENGHSANPNGSSESYPHDDGNTSNDDAEIAFVTSPLLCSNSNSDNRIHGSPSSGGASAEGLLGAMAESTALVRRKSPARTRANHLKLQQQLQSQAGAGGTRKPWRTRNRRFVYNGSINSD